MLEIIKAIAPVAGPLFTFFGILLRRRNDPSITVAKAVANGTSKEMKALLEAIREKDNQLYEKNKEAEMLHIQLQAQRGINDELRLQNRKYEMLIKREKRPQNPLIRPAPQPGREGELEKGGG